MLTHLHDLFAITVILLVIIAAYCLTLRLIRTVQQFLNDCIDLAVAMIFYVFFVPPLWLWHQAQRRMWRTYTRQETNELKMWLRRGG
jgi:hypothetical protein